jgi:hypothetical protein
VLAFAALTAASCIVMITIVSARVAWRSSIRSAIVEGGATTRRVRRGGLSIVSVQVALALVMAVVGALVAGSLLRVLGEDPGFEVSRTALVKVSSRVALPASDIEDLLAGLRRLPGIEHAGGVARPVLEHAFNGSEFDRPTGVMLTTTVESMPATAGYLEATGLAPVDGRLPTASEFESGAPVIVVSDVVAHQYWPGRRAVGQSLVNHGREFAVVGVVPDVRYMSLDMEPQGAIHWPLAAKPRAFPGRILVTFARGGRASLADVTTWFAQRCPTCRPAEIQMLSDALGTSIRPRRFNAWLFSAFGLSALGATRPGVVHQILREQVVAVAAGLLIGGFVAAWAVRFVSAYLYKTPIYDGWAWASAIAALLLVSLLGGLLPSLRASRVDPVQALRTE